MPFETPLADNSMTEMMDEPSPLLLFDVLGGLRTLWHRRALVAVTTIALLSAGVLYLAVTKPIYTAEAAVLVDPRDARATNLDSVLPGIGADSAAISSQVSVIESRDLLGAVFDTQGLANDPEFADPGLLAKLASLVKPAKPLTRDAIFAKFQSMVSAQREGLTYIIDVSFKSHDAEKAARIVNAIVARYQANLAGQSASANDAVSTALSDKIGGLQKAVSDAERAVQDFKVAHSIFDAATGGSVQSQIDQLTTQLVAARDVANQAQDKYTQGLAAGASPQGLDKLSALLSSTTADKLREDYNTRAASLANAQALYGPRHPTIVSLEAELQKFDGLMAAEAQRIVQQLKASRDLASQNVAKLEANLAALRAQGNQSDLAQVQLRELQRQADAARSVLDDFMKRAQETSQMQGLQISQVRIISAAVPPTEVTWPKPLLLLPVSGLLGFATGCALALALGAPKPRLRPAPAPEPAPVEPEATGKAQAGGQSQAMPVPVRRSRIPGLGTYRLPVVPGSTLRGSLKAARLDIAMGDNTALARAVQGLLSQVLGRLDKHSSPYLVLFSSISEGWERRVAADLLGIGLQRIRGNALLIEIAHRAAGPATRQSVSAPTGTGVFVDPTSGLPTIVFDAQTTDRMPVLSARSAREIAKATGLLFDFILIAGPPLGDLAYDAALAREADLEIVVLDAQARPEEEPLLEEPAPEGGGLPHRVSLVIETAAAEPPANANRPRLIVSNASGRQATAASHV
ncbi:MAG: GumC family protein [Devosia sp.]|nr:GumC family protein [Devosia sp.]